MEEIILRLDEVMRKLGSLEKHLSQNFTRATPASAEKTYLLLAAKSTEIIRTIGDYEKTLLFNRMYRDETRNFDDSYYVLGRLQIQKQCVENNIAYIQGLHGLLQEKPGNHNLENVIGLGASLLSSLDEIIGIYGTNKEKLDGLGIEREGELKSGDGNGQGTYICPEGEIYVGPCKNGRPDGYGTVIYPDGSKYSGEVHGHVCAGKGTLYSNGGRYEGEFKDDKFEGYGIFTFGSGDKYEGEFKNGKFAGKGTMAFSDGAKYEGQFQGGSYDGLGTFFEPDGKAYHGHWKDGLLVSQECRGERYQDKASGVSFPKSLAGMTRQDICNYEITSAGQGISVHYVAAGAKGTIYLYNCRLSNIPDSLETDIIRGQFNNAIREIFEAYEHGRYDSVLKVSEGKTYIGNSVRKLEALSSTLIIVADGARNISKIYLTAYKNFFLKIRFSYEKSMEVDGEKRLSFFLDEIGNIL